MLPSYGTTADPGGLTTVTKDKVFNFSPLILGPRGNSACNYTDSQDFKVIHLPGWVFNGMTSFQWVGN